MKKINQLPRTALEMLAIEFGYGYEHYNKKLAIDYGYNDNHSKDLQNLLIKTATNYQLSDYISKSI